ncbi:MAG: hypothetical protein KDC65_06330 [Saprospiraceae bacterium]|nr:hypothetical protein [Saprospiraceae bacterium]
MKTVTGKDVQMGLQGVGMTGGAGKEPAKIVHFYYVILTVAGCKSLQLYRRNLKKTKP